MSIQPNRVIARIIEQVDASDWPTLPSRVFVTAAGDETIRFYWVAAHPRYATRIHFWVHALRDELASRGRRGDLILAAGHALCRNQSTSDWLMELAELDLREGGSIVERLALSAALEASRAPQAYRMLESACRRSTVVDLGGALMAHFWGHGSGESWRAPARGLSARAVSGRREALADGFTQAIAEGVA